MPGGEVCRGAAPGNGHVWRAARPTPSILAAKMPSLSPSWNSLPLWVTGLEMTGDSMIVNQGTISSGLKGEHGKKPSLFFRTLSHRG